MATSPSKSSNRRSVSPQKPPERLKSKAMASLWSLDLTIESGKTKK